jgi:hypothetical protein
LESGDEPARILEIISPAGFEGYFERVTAISEGGEAPDPATVQAVASDYGLEIDLASIPGLIQEDGLSYGSAAEGGGSNDRGR